MAPQLLLHLTMQLETPRCPASRASGRLAAGLLLACVAGCGSTPPEDLPPLRRREGPPPVFLLYVDGLRPDVMERMAREGELPMIRRLFVDSGARPEVALASVPSVTFANAATMVTGLHPGSHGVWANRWFDREGLFTRSYEGVALRDAINDDLGAETIFALSRGRPTAAVGSGVRRGAHLQYAVSLDFDTLVPGVAWTLGMQEELDEHMAEQIGNMLDDARRMGELPALALFYFPALDFAGHAEGCESEAYRAALQGFDRALGALWEVLEAAGLEDEVTLVLTSDHGHVPTPRSFDVADWIGRCAGERALLSGEDDGELDYVARRARYDAHGLVLTVSGERQASLHVRAGDEPWRRRPELERVLALGEPGEGGGDLLERLVAAPAVELVVARAGEDAVLVQGGSGRALVEARRVDGTEALSYRVLRGDDPLGYAEDERARALVGGGFVDHDEWLRRTAHHDRPDVVPQLARTLRSHRAGDVVLFAAPGWDFSPHYAGGHGGLAREELLIPMCFHGPGIGRGVRVPAARMVDLVPTLLDLMEVDADGRAELEGTSFADALRVGAGD